VPGFGPIGSFPVASLPGDSNNAYNIPGKIVYSGSNATWGSSQNIPGIFLYGGNIINPTGARRVSWIGAEVLHSGRGFLHVSSFSMEVLHTGRGFLRISSVEAEVLHNAHADLHISQICVEVLRSIRAQDDAEVTHVY
jgi:hypothetical protein